MIQKLTNLKQYSYILLIMVVAAFLRLYKLDFQSLWMDEIYTLNITDPHLSFKQLLDGVLLTEGFPYLYYIVLKVFYAVFGYSAFAARLLSAVGGIAGVYMIYLLGKEIYNKQVGLVASLLLAINIFHISYSQEARSYSIYFLCILIAFYRLSIFIKNTNLKNAVWYGLSAALLINISFFAFVNIFSHALILLLFIIWSPKKARFSLLKLSLLAAAIVIILFLPNYEILVRLLNYPSFWVQATQADSYTLMFKEFIGTSEITIFILGSIFLYYIVNLFKEPHSRLLPDDIYNSPVLYSFIFLFFWFVTFFGVLFIKSYLGTSLVLSRYFISVVPVFMIVFSIGIYFIKNQLIKTAILSTLVFFIIADLFIVRQYYSGVNKTQYRETAAFIEKNNKDNAIVYSRLKHMYDYYLDNDKVRTALVEKNLDDHINSMVQDSTLRKPFWYADAISSPANISSTTQQYLQKYFTLENNFNGFDAWARYYVLKTKNSGYVDIKKFGILQPANGDKVTLNPEKVEFSNNIIKAEGWGYIDGQGSENTKIQLLLIKDDKAYSLDTEKTYRPDVTAAASKTLGFNFDDCGFKCEQDITSFPAGIYKFAVYFKDATTGKEGLVLTGKEISKN
jgi:uncharacterized membrane protein